jgi:iron complex outermembrane receptor protein
MFRILLGLAILLANFSVAQNSLHGFVKDENGQPYQGIAILIEQTMQATTTDDKGYYLINNIAPGTYALSVDYLYDKQYFTVTVFSKDSSFDIALTRRIEFNEVLVKGYQMDVSRYSNASYFNPEQLQALEKEKDLPYVLRNVSGIIVQSDAGNGIGYTGIRMRGMDPSHVQININGIPFNDCESSLSYFVDIPDIISTTQEITVLKGNVPNRAGTPSFGGAIDINTNKLIFDPFLQIKTQFGSYNSSKYSIQANSGLIENKYNFEFGFSRQKSDGYIDRSESDLKSFRFSGAIIKKNYSVRLNYIHGSESTGQAWNGLPVQYDGIDSLRRYNSAGTEKPGTPYADEKDNYKQDHIQFFYQNQLSEKIILNTSINYTRGSGYYENYKSSNSLLASGQTLGNYFIQSPVANVADLVKRQWLQNDFIFANAGLQINANHKLTLTPGISWSNYSGDHFGQVSWVDLSKYSYLRDNYYQNNGLKKEFSVCLKSSYKVSDKFNISLDLQYRNIYDKIDGKLEFLDSILIKKNYQLFNPKVFAEYAMNKNFHFYSSVGYMQREPFREDLINEIGSLEPEELLDFETGFKYTSKKIALKINSYLMNYHHQLAISGKLSDVGEALHMNLDKSYRLGVEFETECNIADWFALWNSSNLSLNRISKINESIQIVDSLYNLLGYEETLHSNSTISFSPSQLINSGFKMKIYKENKNTPEVSFALSHYYVSDYYLDNYSGASSLLHGYQNLECSLFIQKSIPNLGLIKIGLTIYNLLNEKYASYGWISKFNSPDFVNLASDPYLSTDSKDHYYYKGLFPQALRHVSLGVSINFR